MKRFWSTPEYLRQQRIRHQRAERRHETTAGDRRRRARISLFDVQQATEVVILKPPSVLSVVDTPDTTLGFCDQLRAALAHRHARVRIDLKAVTRLSSDALLLIRAIIDDARGRYQSVAGSLPEDAAVAAKIKQSGFFQGFTNPPDGLPEPQGLIVRKSNTKVDSEVAAELVEFAMRHARVAREIADASYKNLVEVMGNTHNHATGIERRSSRRRQAWQATVYCENDVAYFTFVDLGVGILRSPAPRSLLKRLGASLTDYGDLKLLQEIFQGIIGASADVPGRGFGLQRMRMSAEDNELPELKVVTSSIVGEVAGLKFRTIQPDFVGTLFRWTTKSAALAE